MCEVAMKLADYRLEKVKQQDIWEMSMYQHFSLFHLYLHVGLEERLMESIRHVK